MTETAPIAAGVVAIGKNTAVATKESANPATVASAVNAAPCSKR